MGNATLMGELGAAWHGCEGDDGTVIHVAIDGRYAGHVLISDEARGRRGASRASSASTSTTPSFSPPTRSSTSRGPRGARSPSWATASTTPPCWRERTWG